MPSLAELRDLTAPQRRTLEAVSRTPTLAETFYLTGGTLLKTRGISPRESNDLDFFTFPHVDGRTYMQRLGELRRELEDLFGAAQVTPTDRGFLHTASGMVIDTVADSTSAIDAFVPFDRLQTAGLKDVAAGKAAALCSRDELKDFLDIAFLTRHAGWTLADLARFAEQKFRLGTVTEEKLFTELLAKREGFRVTPELFLRDGTANVRLIATQIQSLLDATDL